MYNFLKISQIELFVFSKTSALSMLLTFFRPAQTERWRTSICYWNYTIK